MTKTSNTTTEANNTTKDQAQLGVHQPSTKVKVTYREHWYRMRISAKSMNPVYHPQHPRLEHVPEEEVAKVVRTLRSDAKRLQHMADEIEQAKEECYLNQEGDLVKGLEADWLLCSVREEECDSEEETTEDQAEEPEGEQRTIEYEPVFGQL